MERLAQIVARSTEKLRSFIVRNLQELGLSLLVFQQRRDLQTIDDHYIDVARREHSEQANKWQGRRHANGDWHIEPRPIEPKPCRGGYNGPHHHAEQARLVRCASVD